jgi:hypothetical protein
MDGIFDLCIKNTTRGLLDEILCILLTSSQHVCLGNLCNGITKLVSSTLAGFLRQGYQQSRLDTLTGVFLHQTPKLGIGIVSSGNGFECNATE